MTVHHTRSVQQTSCLYQRTNFSSVRLGCLTGPAANSSPAMLFKEQPLNQISDIRSSNSSLVAPSFSMSRSMSVYIPVEL